MDSRDIAKLACRLLALYFAAFALSTLAWSIPSFFGSDDVAIFALSYAANFLVNAGIAFFLWRYADLIASRLMPTPSNIELGDVSFEKVQRLAFSLVGLIFAIQGASELLQAAALNVSTQGLTNPWDQPVRAVIKLLLGGLLLVGAGGVTQFLSRLEQDRIPRSETEKER